MKDWTKIGMCFGMAAILGAFLWVKMTYASPLVFQFHSPSFSGIGQSSHYLTIENLETVSYTHLTLPTKRIV